MAKEATTKSADKPKAAAKPKAGAQSKASGPKAVSAKVAKETTADAGAKPNALQQPLTPSKELAEIVGSDKIARGQVVSKVWEYIRNNNLQNPENKREILADDKLEPIFGAKKVTMFEMNKHLSKHLTK